MNKGTSWVVLKMEEDALAFIAWIMVMKVVGIHQVVLFLVCALRSILIANCVRVAAFHVMDAQ